MAKNAVSVPLIESFAVVDDTMALPRRAAGARLEVAAVAGACGSCCCGDMCQELQPFGIAMHYMTRYNDTIMYNI